MKTVQVNAMGDACPLPVVKTKNAIKEMGGVGRVETLVDNEIAVQNLTKMANTKGYEIKSEKISEDEFKVIITVSEIEESKSSEIEVAENTSCIPDARHNGTVIVISSSQMGEGSEELGQALMKAFIFAVTQQDVLPETILFYNGGAKLSCEGSAALEDLQSLQAQGVEILTCGTCLNFYGLTDMLKVGEVTNMYNIVEKMENAKLLIKP